MKEARRALRALVARLTLVALGVVLALGLLEAVLQTGALYVRLTTGERTAHGWLTGGRRILCLGDSNTYGSWLKDRSLAYPQQLENLWNETMRTPHVEVLNLGYPGTNSSRLRKQFSSMLEAMLPDVVTVMVGTNDQWTVPVSLEEDKESWLRSTIVHHSRLYELLYMIRRALDAAPLVVETVQENRGGGSARARYGGHEFHLGWERAPYFNQTFKEKLAENLRFIVEVAQRRRVKLVLMTYPSAVSNYGDADEVIRRVAGETGTRLIDLAANFKEVCPSEPCARWLLRDHHPTADGHHRVAETVLRELRNEL